MAMLGYLLLRENKPEEAENVCAQALRLKEPPVEAMVNLGVILFSRGKDDEARRLWEQALERSPGQPAARLNMERLAADAPDRTIDLYYLARTGSAAGMAPWVTYLAGIGAGYSDADRIRLLTEATQLDPMYAAAHLNLSSRLLSAGPARDRFDPDLPYGFAGGAAGVPAAEVSLA